MNLQRSVLKLLIARSGGSIIGFIATIIFVRELGAAELGVFFLFQMSLSILAVPGSFGRGNSVIKRISEGDNPPSVIGTSLVFFVASSSLLALSIIVFHESINGYIGGNVAVLLAAGLVLRSLYSLPINILKGELRVGETAILNLVQKLFWLVTSFILLRFDLDFYALVYGLLISYTVSISLGTYKVSIPVGVPSWETARSLFSYWKFTIFSYVDSVVYNWADIAVIGLFLSQTEVGIYEVTWRVTGFVILLSIAIENVIFPQISSWEASNSKSEIQDLFPKALLGSVFIAIPALFGSILYSREIMGIFFGEEYIEGWTVLIVLMGGKVVESTDRVLKNFLEGIDLPEFRMRAVMVSIFLNIVLNIILVWAFGIIGAAFATTLAFTTSTLLTTYYLSRNIVLTIPGKEIVWCFISSFSMFVVLYTSRNIVSVSSIIDLIAWISVGASLYVVFSMIYHPIRKRIFYNISQAF